MPRTAVDTGTGYGRVEYRPHSLIERLLFFVVKLIALPIFLWGMVKRNSLVRALLIGPMVVFGGIFMLFGPEATMTVLQLVMQLAYGFGFMIIQFFGLFWFLSKPKTITILPGDEGIITWDDYWGNKPVVEQVKQWAELIRSRGEFAKMGGRCIRGILFIGPPGTGKTYLAKAMAGSTSVAFYGMEGSGFRGMFFGMDVLRVMAFVSTCRKFARKYGACWAYIDELDAIGSRGGLAGGQGQVGMAGGMMGGMMGGGALNRLLTEMDGIETVSQWDQAQNKARRFFGMPDIDPGTVMFVGASNKPELIDAALRRAGRFDKDIVVDKPDKSSRREVIEGYLGLVAHDETVNVEDLVQDTAGATPADIMAAITGDACRIAYFDGRPKISQRDIQDAMQERILGLENPIADLEPQQERQMAVHESGHAIAQYFLVKDQRIVRVSITRRSRALGYMLPVEKADLYVFPLERYKKGIIVGLAGHVAVEIVLGEAWTGASSDFQQVAQRVRALAHFGAFDNIPMGLDPLPKEDKEGRKRVNQFLKDCMMATRSFLLLHRGELDALTEELLDKKDLTGAEAIAVIEGAIS